MLKKISLVLLMLVLLAPIAGAGDPLDSNDKIMAVQGDPLDSNDWYVVVFCPPYYTVVLMH